MDDEYIGGSLKLRGLKSITGNKKKRKRKSTKLRHNEDNDAIAEPTLAPGTSSHLNEHKTSTSSYKKTEAERKFDETLKKRQAIKVAQTASLSHKERVEKFNKYLERLSEHYDIPKVGPG